MAVGSATEDSAKKINKKRATVAQYFPHGGTGGSRDETLSAAPSQAPTSPSCNDSPLEFVYQGQKTTCTAIDANLCSSDANIQAICPSTCGTCSSCADPALTIEFFNTSKGITQQKTCTWVANNSSTRCGFAGISDTCRVTCGSC